MKNSFRYILAATAILALQGMDARVKLPAILTDGMVVQRGEPVRLWVSDVGNWNFRLSRPEARM